MLHELSHIELNARLGYIRAAFGGVPVWFDEGVAVIVSDDPRYLLPKYSAGTRCRYKPDGPLPSDEREWRHSGALANEIYGIAACRVLGWMDANGGMSAVGVLIAATARGERFEELFREKPQDR